MTLILQDPRGLRFAPDNQVASLSPAWPDRVRVVLADGTVGYRPAPLPEGPWVQLGKALVNPGLLRQKDGLWVDPADYSFAYQDLTPAPPTPKPGLPPHIQALSWRNDRTYWQTDEGERECDLTLKQALQVYPDLIFVARALLVNLHRIERILPGGTLVMDTGAQHHLNSPHKTARSLGIHSVFQLDPRLPETANTLREYPLELATAPASWLRAHFESYYPLMKNLIWQAGLYHREGQATDYGTDQASFWQHPIASTLTRAGWPTDRPIRIRFNHLIRELVLDYPLLTLAGLGFADPGPQERIIGNQRPEVLLYSNHPQARQLAEELGLSYLEGDPRRSLHQIEWLARALPPKKLVLLPWVPFGPEPWANIDDVRSQLDRYGLPSGEPLYLLHPEALSAQERETAVPLTSTSPQVKAWLKKTGGVDGRPAQLPAAALPYERARERARQLLEQPTQGPLTFPAPDPVSLLTLEDENGLLFSPLEEVASLVPAPPDRWRVVTSTGQVAYRTQPAEGPWVPLGQAQVAPRWLRRQADQWVDPADFRFPAADLATPPPALKLTESWPGLPCPVRQILSLKDDTWLTDAGPVPTGQPLEVAIHLHPALIQVDPKTWVNRHRLRRLDWDRSKGKWRLLFDNGYEVRVVQKYGEVLKAALALPNLLHLEPYRPELMLDFLREYPFELARAPAAVLKQLFRTPRQLIRNLLWQTRYHRQPGYGNTYRGYWYVPLKAALWRAGFLDRCDPWDPPKDDEEIHELTRGAGIYAGYLRAVAEFVGKYRLFTFQELGFKDARPGQRHIGTTRPNIIVVAEKGGELQDFLKVLQHELGVSTIWFRGQPSLLDTEYFVADLRRVYTGPVLVIAYTDYDPPGRVIGAAFQEQLQLMGLACPQPVRSLVTPDIFSPEELELYAFPLAANTASERTLLEVWLRQTGGIAGQPRGIYANRLAPVERVLKRCRQLLP